MFLKTKTLLALVFCAIIAFSAHATDNQPPSVPQFSQLESIEGSGWEPLEFQNIENRTDYELVSDDGTTVVRAATANSASGLIARQRIDPAAAPVIKWRWKVSNVFEKGDARYKTGDDYPARIYVAFAFEPDQASFLERAKRSAAGIFYPHEIPGTALNYIWANKLKKGSMLGNPFSEETRMVAVTSGEDKAGEWVNIQRNIIEDYHTAFGRTPPAIIGIGIMSDSDNTGESATAWYGDIELLKPE